MVRKITLEKKKKIYELHKLGISMTNIAERYGVSKSTISKILTDAKRTQENRGK
jgi:IS30 family transposase